MNVDLLVQRASLESATVARSASSGEEVETWSEQMRDVPCLMRAVRAGPDVPLGIAELVTHLIIFEVITELLVGRWRAIIDGVSYRLVDVHDPGARGDHYEVYARRYDG